MLTIVHIREARILVSTTLITFLLYKRLDSLVDPAAVIRVRDLANISVIHYSLRGVAWKYIASGETLYFLTATLQPKPFAWVRSAGLKKSETETIHVRFCVKMLI